ncbi:SDR family oxidoreductase [Vibrio sp. SM6]|uniref:SDR family oxidoreductase n=1 Tax=Vibrio agarilyticus TaxID=2726741 RepID=A0A7X8YFQ9_9VIBR|nr:SDR family oxidoreductase [Vibrio agarilyticus]NLS11606.1 SDR family oxidoreductase [Vibrio agarilyticus]
MKEPILITGCSSGIGYTCAHALHQEGYQVIASCRSLDDVKRLQHEGLTCIQLDLNDKKSIDDAVAETLKLTDGKLYALFNNGAYGQPGALEDLPTEALREQFETNVFGWHHLVRQVLPIMISEKRGRIIQNSSVLGFAAMQYRGAYNASKFAIEGWSDTLRLELRNTNVHISILEPGPIETQFRANALAAFQRWIAYETSRHHHEYNQQIHRLSNKKSNNKFTLPPEACLEPLRHALTARQPKIRYRITTPTRLFAVLKRLLPQRWLDSILARAA